MDKYPVGVFALTFFVLAVACAGAGELWGRRAVRHDPKGERALSGYVVGAHLALVSFLVAITFGASMARLDARRGLIVSEANAIGTAELRTRLLPPERADRMRRLLIDYAELRLLPAVEREGLDEALGRSDALLQDLWQETLAAAEAGEPNPPLLTLLVNSMNVVIDENQRRAYVVLHDRIPHPIWWTLAFVSLSAFVTLGYERVLRTRRAPGIPLLAFALTLVLALVEDLDRPYSGLARIDQSPIERTIEAMKDAPRRSLSP